MAQGAVPLRRPAQAASQDVDAFRLTIQKESAEQVRFRESLYDKIGTPAAPLC